MKGEIDLEEEIKCSSCFCDTFEDTRGKSPNFSAIYIQDAPFPVAVGPVPGTGGTLIVASITLTKVDKETCCAHFVVVTLFNAGVVVPGFPNGIYTAETVIDCNRIQAYQTLPA